MKNSDHGSPFDRGSADAYYGRESDPHYYPAGSYVGERIGREKMTEMEIESYLDGYEDQIASGIFKEW